MSPAPFSTNDDSWSTLFLNCRTVADRLRSLRTGIGNQGNIRIGLPTGRPVAHVPLVELPLEVLLRATSPRDLRDLAEELRVAADVWQREIDREVTDRGR